MLTNWNKNKTITTLIGSSIVVLVALAIIGVGKQTFSDLAHALMAKMWSACATKHIPTSVLDVPPEDMRFALENAYRLRPDNRFMLAVGDIHYFLSRKPKENAQATFSNEKWVVCYRGEVVGELPEFAGFEDWAKLLSDWTKRIDKAHRLNLTSTNPRGEPEIEDWLERFNVSDGLSVIRQLNKKWVDGKRSPADFYAATRVFTIMVLQQLDRMEIADSMTARALAVLVMTKSLTDYDVQRDEAILSKVLGHELYAKEVALRLPVTDPIRSYITKDDESLRIISKAKDGTVESRYLYLLRLSALRRTQDSDDWQRAFFPNPFALPILKAMLDHREFDTNRSVAPLLPYFTVAAVAHEIGHKDLDIDLPAIFSEKASTADVQTAVERFKKLLQLDTQSLATRLESDLAVLGGDIEGPFLDASTIVVYYRAFFYSALFILGKHYLDALSSVDAVKSFIGMLGEPRSGIASDFMRWYSSLAQAKDAHDVQSKLLVDLADFSSLGVPPIQRTYMEFSKRVSYGNPDSLVAIKRLTARMDDRVSHRRKLATVAYTNLHDLHLSERLYRSVIQISGDPQLTAWYIGYFTNDKAALEVLLNDPKIDLKTRIHIPSYLRKLGAPASEIDSVFQRLIGEDPLEDWEILNVYVNYLRERKQYKEVRHLIKQWLNRHSGDGGFPYIFATTALARVYYDEGRYREGYEVIKLVISSQQAGVMKRGALLLEKLGRLKEAEELAGALLARYPDGTSSMAILAGFYWRNGEYEAAAKLIKQRPYRIGAWDWRRDIGPQFNDAFEESPNKALMAFSFMLAAGIDHLSLHELIEPFSREGRHELAFKMESQLSYPGLGKVVFLIRSYKHLKAWQGEEIALAWLRKSVPLTMLNASSMIIYSEGEFDLLWNLIENPEQGDHPYAVWLIRAAAFIKQGDKDITRQQALTEYFKRPGDTYYHSLGRYLMGQISEQKALTLITKVNERCEAAYYIGLRAASEGRYYDASDWFRVAVETGLIRMSEYRWAHDNLLRWVNIEKSLSMFSSATEMASVTDSADDW